MYEKEVIVGISGIWFLVVLRFHGIKWPISVTGSIQKKMKV